MENGALNFCYFFTRRSADHLKAPGEAEAELAYLNSVGIIDAVLSDDVDNFLFSAKIVIRKCALAHPPAQTTSPFSI